MRLRFAVFAFCLLLTHLAKCQTAPNAITNDDVISMTKAGIGEQTIILAIQRGPVKFDTSPQALIALKGAGVSDKVLNAMLGPVSNTYGQQPAQTQHLAENCSPSDSNDAARVAYYNCQCNNGDMDACANLGFYFSMGWGISKDSSQAMALFKKACEGGSGIGCRYQDGADRSETTSNSDEGGKPSFKSSEISDLSERRAFENAVALTDPAAKSGNLEAFLQAYPQSVAKPAVLQMLAAIKSQAETNAPPPQTPNPASIPRAPEITSQGLSLRVLQAQSIPYIRESRGGISTTCNIVGTANTSAYVNTYGNSAYGNATTDSNQRMNCSSYDTTIRWPHVLNVMFAQASDGNSYIIACDKAWRWSKCVPLRAGDTFNAHFTGKGIEIQAVNSKGKEENPTYQILQSKAWR